jgi:cytochrome b-561
VHNIAEYGPNDPASTPTLVMPDWFLMWGYGFLKLTPGWMSFDLLGIHISAEFIGGLVLTGLVFLLVALWPFIDYEDEAVHFTADPLDRPFQTAVGVAGVVFVLIASVAGMDVILAEVLGTSTAVLRPYLTAALLGAPILGGLVVYAGLGGFGETEPPDSGPPDAAERGDEQ